MSFRSRFRLPTQFHAQHPARKVAAAGVVALAATVVALLLRVTPGVRVPLEVADHAMYDGFYRLRTPVPRKESEIVVITISDLAVNRMDQMGYGWPWSREVWDGVLRYLDEAKAKVVVFDMFFETRSVHRAFNDDGRLATAIDQTTVPVIVGARPQPGGGTPDFKTIVPVEQPGVRPRFAAVNILDEQTTIRHYPTVRHGMPSLAAKTVETIGRPVPAWADGSFLLHYYGPHQAKEDGDPVTYRYYNADDVFWMYTGNDAALADDTELVERIKAIRARTDMKPEYFRDKIVLIGATSAATYDLKQTPLRGLYPGVEVHATAIDNLLHGDYVRRLGVFATGGLTLLATFAAGLLVVFPKHTWVKLSLAAGVAVASVLIAQLLFRGGTIVWLPLAGPLLALILATVGAFAWSYLTEGRQRRFIHRALSQYLSPEVAEEVERQGELKLSGERREMTVMFTDIQGFTDLSEKLEEKITDVLNFYLGEMSPLVHLTDGTLDKYIGDAIMSFWNAPIPQIDHAARACRAALALEKREYEILPKLAELGATGLLTRIGVNTGPMTFGNMGSQLKFNYTVIGDAVNLGARLEGANKIYGSRILIAQSTADLVKGQFAMRQLDLMRVKGKLKPVGVYELMIEGPGDAAIQERIAMYEDAFSHYQAMQWEQSEKVLEDLIAKHPNDLPAKALLKRVHEYKAEPPPEDWDGVYVAKGK